MIVQPEFILDRPVLLLAGPGTGKTTRLVSRILYLIKKAGVSRETILAVTFTKKAARQMQRRLEKKGLALKDQPRMSTLHSFAARILRQYASEIGLEDDFQVAGDFEARLVLSDAAQEIGYLIKREKQLNKLWRDISLLKAGVQLNHQNSDLSNLFATYTKLLSFHRAVDFGDLILKTIDLLESYPHIDQEIRGKCDHLLVDEFQDINRTEYRLIRSLAGSSAKGLFVVGDDDQSIYGWRGGTPEIILNFTQEYSNGIEKVLNICYRCNEKIVKGALEFIRKSCGKRRDKDLRADSGGGQLIQIIENASDTKEAKWISATIGQLINRYKYKGGQIAILFRGGDVVDKVARELVKIGIQVVRPSPEDTKAVYEVMAHLRLIANPLDSLALRTCLGSKTAVGIDKAGMLALLQLAKSKKISLWHCLNQAVASSTLKRWHKHIQCFLQYVQELQGKASRLSKQDLVKVVADTLECTGQPSVIKLHERAKLVSPDATLQEFIEQIRGRGGEDQESGAEHDQEGVVLLTTTHSVKGLERDIIFVIGVDKDTFPSPRGDQDEERRLFYVAMTRAKNRLYLCYTRMRKGQSAQGWKRYDRSPFLFDIPKEVFVRKHVS